MAENEFAPVTPGEMLKQEFGCIWSVSKPTGEGDRNFADRIARSSTIDGALRQTRASARPLFRQQSGVLGEFSEPLRPENGAAEPQTRGCEADQGGSGCVNRCFDLSVYGWRRPSRCRGRGSTTSRLAAAASPPTRRSASRVISVPRRIFGSTFRRVTIWRRRTESFAGGSSVRSGRGLPDERANVADRDNRLRRQVRHGRACPGHPRLYLAIVS